MLVPLTRAQARHAAQAANLEQLRESALRNLEAMLASRRRTPQPGAHAGGVDGARDQPRAGAGRGTEERDRARRRVAPAAAPAPRAARARLSWRLTRPLRALRRRCDDARRDDRRGTGRARRSRPSLRPGESTLRRTIDGVVARTPRSPTSTTAARSFEMLQPRPGVWATSRSSGPTPTSVRPGQVKGWARHEVKVDRYSLVAGELLVLLHDGRPDSPTPGPHPARRPLAGGRPPDSHPGRGLAPARQRRHLEEVALRQPPDRALPPRRTRPASCSPGTPTSCPSTYAATCPSSDARKLGRPRVAPRGHTRPVPTHLTTARHLDGLREAMPRSWRTPGAPGSRRRCPPARTGRCSTWSRTRGWCTAGPPPWCEVSGRPTRRSTATRRPAGPSTDPLAWLSDGRRRAGPVDHRRSRGPRGAGLPERRAPGPWLLGPPAVPRDHDPRGRRAGRVPRPGPAARRGLGRPRAGRRRHRRAARRVPHPAPVAAALRRGRAARRTPGRPGGLVGGRHGPAAGRHHPAYDGRRAAGTTPTGS